MRSIRWLWVGAVPLLLLGAVGIASACLEPRLGHPGSAGPGDPVPFTISGTTAGAAYTVRVDGTPVTSGTDVDGNGHASSFVMPDLGDSHTADIELVITHGEDASTIVMSSSMQFTAATPAPPAPVVAPPPVEPAPAAPSPAGAAPAAEPGSSASRPSATAPAPVPRGDDRPAGEAPRSASPASARRGAVASPQAEAVTPEPPVASLPEATGPRAAATPRPDGARASGNRAAAPDRATAPQTGTVPAPGDRQVASPAEPARVHGGPGSVAPLALVLAAVLIAAAGAGGLRALRRAGGGPEPHAPSGAPEGDGPGDLDMEAALQEMVAEERARAVLRGSRRR